MMMYQEKEKEMETKVHLNKNNRFQSSKFEQLHLKTLIKACNQHNQEFRQVGSKQ